MDPRDVERYLTKRLNRAIDKFLRKTPQNAYAKIDKDAWTLSVDQAEQLSPENDRHVSTLLSFLSSSMNSIY